MELTLIQKIVVLIIPVLLAITVHEAAHGWMAAKLGDKTAKMLGRVTLNPLKHIDPFGTIILPLLMFLFTPIVFGWAKPVPVDWRNFSNPKKDMGLVAIAGPGSNLIMAFIWAVVANIGGLLSASFEGIAEPLMFMGAAGVLINAVLMALNIIPIPPLDGGRVLNSLLPPKQSMQLSKLEPYGLFIVVGLLLTGILWGVLGPIIGLTIDILPASEIVIRKIQILFLPAS
jgi:Zn-dependent protease